MKPDIPFSEYGQEAARDVFIVVEPVALKIEAGELADARSMLARLTTWFLDKIAAGELEPEKARDAFFLLHVYLTDNYAGEILGEEAHALIYEGTMLHELGEDYGADVAYMRELARRITVEAEPER